MLALIIVYFLVMNSKKCKRQGYKTIKIYIQTGERGLPINRGWKPGVRSIKTFKKDRIEIFSIPLHNIFQCYELR